MSSMIRPLVRGFALAAVVAMTGGAGPGPERYAAFLGPAPINDATKPKIRGRATAAAVLQGAQLNVTGKFSGLASAATTAELRAGAGVGVPGSSIAPLRVTSAVSGNVEGQVALSGPQLAALRAGRLYIQINSQSAPEGNLLGWLLAPTLALPGTRPTR